MIMDEYNRLATDIALRIGQHIVAGGECDSEHVKALKEQARQLSEQYWRGDE